MSKKLSKPQQKQPSNMQVDSQKSIGFSAVTVEKLPREDVGVKHKVDALAMARTSLANLLASAEDVLDAIEMGKDMKMAFTAHKVEVDGYSRAINKLSLHAAPKAAAQ